MYTRKFLHFQIQSLKKKKQSILNSVKSKSHRRQHIKTSIQVLQTKYLQKIILENQRKQYKNELQKLQLHILQLNTTHQIINTNLVHNRQEIDQQKINIEDQFQHKNCQQTLNVLRLQLIQIQGMQSSSQIKDGMKISSLVCKFIKSINDKREQFIDFIDIEIPKNTLCSKFRCFVNDCCKIKNINLSQIWERYLKTLQKAQQIIHEFIKYQQITDQMLSFQNLINKSSKLGRLKQSQRQMKLHQQYHKKLVNQEEIKLQELSQKLNLIDHKLIQLQRDIETMVKYIDRRNCQQNHYEQIELRICQINDAISYFQQKCTYND